MLGCSEPSIGVGSIAWIGSALVCSPMGSGTAGLDFGRDLMEWILLIRAPLPFKAVVLLDSST